MASEHQEICWCATSNWNCGCSCKC